MKIKEENNLKKFFNKKMLKKSKEEYILNLFNNKLKKYYSTKYINLNNDTFIENFQPFLYNCVILILYLS